MAPPHIAHQTTEAAVVSICENFCRSPSAVAAYMLVQKLNHSADVCSKVLALKTPVLNLKSFTTSVTGNEAGVGGGVPFSGVNCGICKPHSDFASTVQAEGACVIRHDTVMEMNCSSKEAPGDTFGRIAYCVALTNPKKDSVNDPADMKLDKKDVPILDEKGKVMTDPPNDPKGKPLTVDIYKTNENIGGGYNSGDKIVLRGGGGSDEYTLENEMQTRRDDARNGKLGDGVLQDENGNPLSENEAEIRSDEAASRRAKQRQEIYDTNCGSGDEFQEDHPILSLMYRGTCVVFQELLDYKLSQARKAQKDYEELIAIKKKGEELVKAGKYDEAQKLADGPGGQYVQNLLNEACGR